MLALNIRPNREESVKTLRGIEKVMSKDMTVKTFTLFINDTFFDCGFQDINCEIKIYQYCGFGIYQSVNHCLKYPSFPTEGYESVFQQL